MFFPHLLFHLVLQLTTAEIDRGTDSTPHPVPAPFNLTLKSYNFNTTLYWAYSLADLMPYFQVEIMNYNIGKNWTVVQSCQRISETYCDLSKLIIDPKSYYNVRVKSFVGSMESEYETKKDFCLRIHGIIGPPTLSASWNDNNIVVEIWHPLVPSTEEEPQTIQDIYNDFEYDLYLTGINFTYKSDECFDDGCIAYIVPPSKDGRVCISAKGSSEYWVVVGEKSKETCIQLKDEDAEGSYKRKNILILAFVILCFVFFVGVLICAVAIKIRARDKLPKFLNNLTKNRYSSTLLKYNNSMYVSKTPIEITGNTTSIMEDVISHKETSVQPFSQEQYDTEYERAMTEKEEQQSEPESDSSNSNCYHTDNGHKDGDISIDSLILENKEEIPTNANPVSKSYGYDKPHVPLDLLTQMSKDI